jgi:DNA-binding LytR/AlgR family response regulator
VAFFGFWFHHFHTLASLRDLEEQLPSSHFIRIHKSFIVSIHAIESLEGNRVEIGGTHLSVGKSYRPDVEKIFGIK